MPIWLKQSTAVVVSFGPFVDKTDGVTLETGLVSSLDHASTGIFLSKNGGTLTIRHATVTASSYDAYGNYKVTLDTTDTNTLGTLRMQFSEAATCLPVWQDFMVVPGQVWDSYFGADLLQVDAQQFGNTNGSFSSGRPEVNTTHAAGTAWGSGAITAAALAADAGTEIAAAVWDMDATGHQTQGTFGQAIGDPAADTNTIFKAVVTDATLATVGLDVAGSASTADIATAVWQDTTAGDFTVASSIGKALYTGNFVPGAAGGLFIAGTNAATTVNFTGSLSGSVGSVTGAVGSVTGLTASDVGAIKTKTDPLTYTVANVVDVNIQRVNDVVVTGNGQSGTEWGP